jgi:hypothetical protein
MNGVKATTIFSLTAVVLAMMTVPAMAYTIDGDLDDWGVHPPGDWYADAPALNSVENWPVGPNKGGNPGVEQCDIEAMYVADGGSYIYFAIITSMPLGGFDYPPPSGPHHLIPGDLALNIDNGPSGEYGYEYGIKLTTDSRTVPGVVGDVFYLPDWEKLNPEVAQPLLAFSNMVPGAGTKTRHADINYTLYSDWPADNGADNYVIEMAVPKSALGISGSGTADLLATVSCTNDVIEIKDFHYEIPEFTTVAIPVGMIIGLFYFFSRKRKQ